MKTPNNILNILDGLTEPSEWADPFIEIIRPIQTRPAPDASIVAAPPSAPVSTSWASDISVPVLADSGPARSGDVIARLRM